MKKIIVLFTIPFTLFFFRCSSSPDKAIEKRWVEVGVRGSDAKKQRVSEILARKSSEIEFKDGKFNGYTDGAIMGSAPYSMASDGKSLVITDGGKSATVKIITLNAETLETVLVGSGFMFSGADTVIYKVAGSSDAKKENAAAKQQLSMGAVQNNWELFQVNCQRRSDLANMLQKIAAGVAGFNQAQTTLLLDALTKARQAEVAKAELESGKIKAYVEAQNSVKEAIAHFLGEASNNASFKSSKAFADLQMQLEGVENRIHTSAADFNKAVNEYAATGGDKKDLTINIK